MIMDELKKDKYSIRPIIRADRVVLTGLFEKFMDATGNRSMSQLFVADESKSSGKGDKKPTKEELVKQKKDTMGYTANLLMMMLDIINSDVSEWFASLINVDMNKFNTLPISIELDIITQITLDEDVLYFFKLASSLYSKTTELLNKLDV